MTSSKITADVQSLSPSAIVEMFELDATNVGAGVFQFHAGTNNLSADLVWQGVTYLRYPVEVTGFEISGQGQLPRPKMKVSNYLSTITALLLQYQDLIGAKVTRKRTLAKYIDSVNFPTTNPNADPTAFFPDDIYYIDRKASESRDVIEFELASSLDLAGVTLPRRQIIQNLCPFKYRGAECGYSGTSYFKSDDTPTGNPSEDVCGKRLTSCKKRFGSYAELPFGGFPGAGLLRL